jgi:hypothetical protein
MRLLVLRFTPYLEARTLSGGTPINTNIRAANRENTGTAVCPP